MCRLRESAGVWGHPGWSEDIHRGLGTFIGVWGHPWGLRESSSSQQPFPNHMGTQLKHSSSGIGTLFQVHRGLWVVTGVWGHPGGSKDIHGGQGTSSPSQKPFPKLIGAQFQPEPPSSSGMGFLFPPHRGDLREPCYPENISHGHSLEGIPFPSPPREPCLSFPSPER